MLTRPKDLHGGRSLWASYPVPRIPHELITADQKSDVVIIGAGISGAMIALELLEAGFSVTMVDRRKPMYGSTIASTALVQFDLDTPLTRLSKKIGFNDAAMAWRRSRLGLESLAVKIRMLGLPCRFERKETLYFSGDVLSAAALVAEQKERDRVGIPSAYLDRKEIKKRFGISREAALHCYDNIAINPIELTAGLLQKALKLGARIYSPVAAVDMETSERYVWVRTSPGPVIRCRFLVFASGYELPEMIKANQHKIRSTWVMSTKRNIETRWKGLPFIWEASNPYIYVRSTHDGRVICGGEDEDFVDEESRDKLTPAKVRTLQRKLSKLYPTLDTTAEYTWAGSFGDSTTGLPTIGRIPGKKNCFAALAYGGNGITFSRIAAEIISSTIQGKDDPDKDLFRFRE